MCDIYSNSFFLNQGTIEVHSLVLIRFQSLYPTLFLSGAAIAQWINLTLPSCRPGFESQAHHLCFHNLQSNLCYICHVKRTKINRKRPRLAHCLPPIGPLSFDIQTRKLTFKLGRNQIFLPALFCRLCCCMRKIFLF